MNAQHMVLADRSHKLPMPGSPRLFSAEGETVDLHNPFWRALLADGSIKPADAAPGASAAPQAGSARVAATAVAASAPEASAGSAADPAAAAAAALHLG